MINAEFSTAQAVTPGQGQTVTVSGVQVGEIGGVSLKNGTAVVAMDIDHKYKNLIHTDATALLRPRTGLKDMFIELDPGTLHAPVAKPGFTIPVSNTEPDINVDEILASLDADTREYLDLLVNGAGQGLKGKGGDRARAGARALRAHPPGPRAAERRRSPRAGPNLRQLVNSLQRLNTARSPPSRAQIVQLIDSSSNGCSAPSPPRISNVSRAVADLPATLSQTTATLAKVQAFANQLGPAARNLLPAATALPAANAALSALAKPSTPIVAERDPPVRDRRAAPGAQPASPRRSTS